MAMETVGTVITGSDGKQYSLADTGDWVPLETQNQGVVKDTLQGIGAATEMAGRGMLEAGRQLNPMIYALTGGSGGNVMSNQIIETPDTLAGMVGSAIDPTLFMGSAPMRKAVMSAASLTARKTGAKSVVDKVLERFGGGKVDKPYTGQPAVAEQPMASAGAAAVRDYSPMGTWHKGLDTTHINMTPAQKKWMAANNEQEALAAERELAKEEGKGAQSILDIKRGQRHQAASEIKNMAGMNTDEALTDTAIANRIEEIGKELDTHAANVGTVDASDLPEFVDDLMLNAAPSSEKVIGSIVKDLQHYTKGGTLSGENWQRIRTKLTKAHKAALAQGDMAKLEDINSLMGKLTEKLETSALTPEQLASVSQARKQYRMVNSISHDTSGNLNIQQTNRNWQKWDGKKKKGTDNFSQRLQTYAALTAPVERMTGGIGRTLTGIADIGELVGMPGTGLLRNAARVAK